VTVIGAMSTVSDGELFSSGLALDAPYALLVLASANLCCEDESKR